jgi:N-acetylneuraminic acid mutarotase
MCRPLSKYLTWTFGALALGACADSPHEPETAGPTEVEAITATPLAASTWTTRATMPKGRFLGAAATLTTGSGQPIVYWVAGSSAQGAITKTVQAYNAVTNSWTQKADYPVQAYHTNGAGVIGGKLYVSGGVTIRRIALEGLYAYDPATNTWTARRSLPSAGHRGVTGVIGDKLYVLTGCGAGADCDGPEVAFYRYDPVTDQWTALPAPVNAHGEGGGGVIGGKFYVAGGRENDGRRLDVYDPGTNTWTSRAPMPNGRRSVAGVALGGKLYVIGGLVRNSNGTESVVRTTSVYDPGSNTWSHVAPLPAASANYLATRVVVDGSARIEAVGGAGAGNNLQFTP